LDLSGGDFSESIFSGSFKGANLGGANMMNTFLASVNFDDANAEGCNFSNAYLARSSFCGAILKSARFSGSNLTCAILDNICNLDQSSFLGANLNGVSFNNTILSGARMDEKYVNVINKLDDIRNVMHCLDDRLVKLEMNSGQAGGHLVQEIPCEIDNYFFGRRDLHLQRCFLENPKMLLLGIAGSGKSQLSSRYAKGFLKDYPDSLIYRFDAGSISDLDNSYYELATKLLEKSEIANKELGQILSTLFIEINKRSHSLLIFDDVNDVDVMNKLVLDLRKLCKSNCNCNKNNQQILITSQDGSLSMPGGFNTLLVSGWDVNECLLFLAGSNNISLKTRTDAEALAAAFDGLPLGIYAARLYIEANNISVSKYLERINDERLNIGVEEKQSSLMEAHYAAEIAHEKAHTLEAAIRLAIKVASDDSRGVKYLRYCAFLSPDRIPITLLTGLIEGIDPNQVEIMIEAEVSAFMKRSLVTVNGIDNDRTFTFLKAVQQAQRNILSLEDKASCMKLLANTLMKRFTRNNISLQDLGNNLSLLPHVERVVNYAIKSGLNITPSVIALQVAMGTFYDFNGDPLRAKMILSIAKLQLESAIAFTDDYSQNCLQLIAVNNQLPTLYGQILYHLGKSYLSIWQSQKIYHDDESNEIALNSFRAAVEVRRTIDALPTIYDDKFNYGNPRPMDSTIFKRNGVLLWHKFRGTAESLDIAINGYRDMINAELTEVTKDLFNLSTCRRLEIECMLDAAIDKSVVLSADQLNSAIEAISETIGITQQLPRVQKTQLLDLMFEKLNERAGEVRIGREYNLIGKVLIKLYSLSRLESDLQNAKRFVTCSKSLEESNNRKSFILEDANELLKQIENVGDDNGQEIKDIEIKSETDDLVSKLRKQ